MIGRRRAQRTLLVATLLAASGGLCSILWLASGARPQPSRAVHPGPADAEPRRESEPASLVAPLAVAPEPADPAPETAVAAETAERRADSETPKFAPAQTFEPARIEPADRGYERPAVAPRAKKVPTKTGEGRPRRERKKRDGAG